MSTILTTIPAHFDGNQVQFDVDVELEPHTRLLITILAESASGNEQVRSAMQLSEAAFARIWDNEGDAIYDSL